MPDAAVHAAFGRDVLSALPAEIASAIRPEPWTFGLFGPDVWFMYHPWRRRGGRGRRMHTSRTGAFLTALAERVRQSGSEELFSWLAGFFCHYALDSTAHPYIIDLSTRVYRYPRCHMSLEHELDRRQIARDGWEAEKHPVTKHYFLPVRLPASVRADVDAVFERAYGWKHAWRDINRSCRRYRLCYRLMESPTGPAARLARWTGASLLRSLACTESQFRGVDVENTEHRPWQHSHDPLITRRDSFPELREQALSLAVSLIEAAFRYAMRGEGSLEELAQRIGNRSYLSGLDAEDSRNHAVPSLLPSQG